MAKKDSIVSVEIMDNGIRAAEIAGHQSQRPLLLRYGFMPLPMGSVRDGAPKDAEHMGKLLKSLWKKSEFKSDKVIVGMSSRAVITKEVRLPNIPAKALKESLPLEVGDILPGDSDNPVLDFYPLELSADGNSLVSLVVAASQERVENLLLPFVYAGLTVDYVDFSPFGLSVAARSAVGPEDEFLIVNVNAKNSELVMMRDGVVRLARIVSSGVSVTPEPEEDEVGDYFYNSPMFDPDENHTEQVLSSVASTIQHYQSKGGSVNSVLFTGEGTLSEYLLKRARGALGIPVETLDLDMVIGSTEAQEEEQKSRFVESCILSTVGLGMRGLK